MGGWGFRSDPGFALAGGPGAGSWPAAAMDRAELTTEQVSAWDCLLTRFPNLFQLQLLMPVSFIVPGFCDSYSLLAGECGLV